MRLLTSSCRVALALAGVGVPLRAQSADALYAGRSCNQDFAKLRAVSVRDVVDSGALVTALREAADSASPITKVVLSYDAYGQLSRIKTAGTRSPAADTSLERQLRTMAKPVTGMPSNFMATIVRLNRRDLIDISPFPFTCPPMVSSTLQATRFIQEGQRVSSPPPRDAVVGLWLRSSGECRGRVDRPERSFVGVGQSRAESYSSSAILASFGRDHASCHRASGPGPVLSTACCLTCA